MLLTIRLSRPAGASYVATDLGYLLGKNPSRTQCFDLPSFGKAYVFYPEATEDACTFVLLLDIDSVMLVRGREGSQGGGTLDDYVNDRPYVASSFFTVGLRTVLSSALKGSCKNFEHLVKQPLPLQCTIASLPCRRGEELIKRLFEPLGYKVTCTGSELDSQFPEWGASPYFAVQLTGEVTLQALLTHLFVLIPVLDNSKKHYAVGDDEVSKLIRHGAAWLNAHPDRELITRRYLGYKDGLTTKAIEALDAAAAEDAENEPEEEPLPEPEGGEDGSGDPGDAAVESAVPSQDVPQGSLHAQRHQGVLAAAKASGGRSLVDLGCGHAQFLELVVPDPQFERILGVELSPRVLRAARKWLRKAEKKARPLPRRTHLAQGSVLYRDPMLKGFDVGVCIEVIEHLEPSKLDTFAYVVFGDARPGTVIVTTPNVEYNVRFETMQPGQLRHRDHKFEWTRAQFQAWCARVARVYNYEVSFEPLGPVDPEVGAPSQMAVFKQRSSADAPNLQNPTVLAFSEFMQVSPELGAAMLDSADAPAASLASESFDDLPRVEDFIGEHSLSCRLLRQPVPVGGLGAQIAFEELNTHVVDPRWLIYVPPTMSPCATSRLDGVLEHPAEAFKYFADSGVKHVVCEEKHMGSRAVVIVARSPEAAKRRFGVDEPAGGIVYTRMGRRFFTDDYALETAFLASVRQALTDSGFWSTFNTDWVALDCELMPWSAKAQGLIRNQYASTACAAHMSLPQAVGVLQQGMEKGLTGLEDICSKTESRLANAGRYRQAYRAYCWDVKSLADYQLAPFHVLATEGAVHTNEDHIWHMETLAAVAAASKDGLVKATPYLIVSLEDAVAVAGAISWWTKRTAAGGEGMVVKPLDFITRDQQERLVQPAVKVRGAEYLRIIYGPDYLMPHQLERLRERGLFRKRSLAEREFALGVESLHRFVERQPLARVLECSFAVLALETNTGCDPRL